MRKEEEQGKEDGRNKEIRKASKTVETKILETWGYKSAITAI